MALEDNSNEHRTFLLTLDADAGPSLAAKSGFTPASQDVGEKETMQVQKDWATLHGEGTINNLSTYAKWFTDATIADHHTPTERMMQTHALITFTGAVIARLKNRGLLETPANRRMYARVWDSTGRRLDTNDIPEELIDAAAEWAEWRATEGGSVE